MGNGVTNTSKNTSEANEIHQQNAVSTVTGIPGENEQNATGIEAKMAKPSHWGARHVRTNIALEHASSFADNDFIEDKREYSIMSKTTNQGGEKDLKDCNVVLIQKFTFSDVIDGKDSLCTGIACLSDGRVVVADRHNNICCLYDNSYNYMSDFMLSSYPMGICTVETDEVAVTLPSEKKIQFLKIGDTIHPSGQIATRRKCLAVVALNQTELVYAGTTPDDITYYWGIITRLGLEKSCFHISCDRIIDCDVYIALDSFKTRVYISCFGDKAVYCVGLDGMVYFKYRIDEVEKEGSPAGIQLDRENNVYVTVFNSHSIHRLSPDCKRQQIFQTSIPHFPNAICFKQSSDNFLLSSTYQDTCNVCHVYTLK